MNETYVFLGNRIHWTTPLMVAILVGGHCLVSFWLKKPLPNRAQWFVLGVTIGLVGVGFPLELALEIILVVSLSSIWHGNKSALQTKKLPTWGLLVLTAVGLSAVAWFAGECAERTRLTLTSDRLKDAGWFKVDVPRQGLEIHALGPAPPGHLLYGYSWTTYARGRPLPDSSGPYVTGSEVYWGPHGFISGDDVGRRLASWSGSKIQYQTREELDAKIQAQR